MEVIVVSKKNVKCCTSNLTLPNIDKWLDAINNDTDKYQYFEVNTTDKSYRWIANGAEPDLIGKTAAEAQLLIFKDCKTDDCNITKLLEASSYMVRRGGGFNAYLWQGTPEAQAALHISYSFPFAYKNIALYLCSGYKPPWLKDYMRTEAPQVVEKMLQLISEVGLENALSTIRKTNQSRLFVFVVEQTYPYIILEYFDPILTNKTAVEATAAAHKRHNPSVNYVKLFADMIDFVQFQDGFYAYEFTEPIAHAITKLKIGYIKSLTYNKKKYVIGATYVSLQT